MKNTKLTATLASIAVLGAGFLTLANAQTVTGTVTGGTGTTSGRPAFMQNLTDAQKAVMEQAKSLFQAGKKDEAKALLEQNGIKMPLGGHSKGLHADMRKVDEAISNGDYATFVTLASTTPFAKIDQATFNLLTPQFKAKTTAETNIQGILKNAGIEMTGPGGRRGPPQTGTN